MPNVIDLYAGAGGLSLGAARAGFTVTAAVELEPHAIEYYGINRFIFAGDGKNERQKA